jgi:hypothetical protein
MHFAVTSFWDQYDLLPPPIKRLADKNYQLLKQNPKHPSLHFKKIRQQLYSVRVGEHYRALGLEKAGDLYWFWIGSHAEYDKILSSPPGKGRGQ